MADKVTTKKRFNQFMSEIRDQLHADMKDGLFNRGTELYLQDLFHKAALGIAASVTSEAEEKVAELRSQYE